MAFVRNLRKCANLIGVNLYRLSSSGLSSNEFAFKQMTYNYCKTYQRYLSVPGVQRRYEYTQDVDQKCKRISDSLQRFGAIEKSTIMDVYNSILKTNKITSSQALFLLHCCGSAAAMESKETRNKLVSDIWDSFAQLGFTPDISHYNTLLKVFIDNDYKFSPLDFLSTLHEKNIHPNRLTFTRLLTKFCEDGDMEGADKILNFLKDEGLNVSEGAFNSLIIGYARAKDTNGVNGILETMKQSGVTPGPSTYAALLQAYGELGETERVMTLLHQFDADEIFISDPDFLDAVYALSVQGKAEVVNEILPRMKKSVGYIPRAINMSCLLINAGCDEVAYKIFKSTPSKSDLQFQGRYFPRQLGANDYPLTKVVSYCSDLCQSRLNTVAYENALEGYLQISSIDKAMALLRVMRENNVPIREHYFYPMFCVARDLSDVQKVYKIYEEICQFEVKFSSELIDKYLLAALKPSPEIKNMTQVFTDLIRLGPDTDVTVIHNAIVLYLLNEHGLKFAAQFCNEHRRTVLYIVRGPLVDAYFKTLNARDTCSILRQMLPLSLRRMRRTDATADSGAEVSENFTSILRFMLMVISGLKSRNIFQEQFPLLLQSMLEKGVCVDSQTVATISDRIGVLMTSEIEGLLSQLTDTSIIPAIRRQNVDVRIQEIENKGDSAPVELKTELIRLHLVKSNLEEAKKVLDELKSEGVEIPNEVSLLFCKHYIDADQLEEAEKIFNYLKDEHPEFQISASMVTKYAAALVEKDRFEDAAKVCLMHSPEDGDWPEKLGPENDESFYRMRINNMLNYIVDKKDLSSLKLLQEALLNKKLARPATVLASLIRYYIEEDNVEKALEEFQRIFMEHKATPAKFELSAALIEKSDTERLQSVLDISNEVHGEMNTLFDLAIAFIEAGKPLQAEKVLETSGMRANKSRVDERCNYYLKKNKIKELEDLVRSTKHLFGVDRQALYEFLLEGQISCDDPNKALGVWMSMQEEGIIPTDEFLWKLGRFLQSKDIAVPFTIPLRISKPSIGISSKTPNQRRQRPLLPKDSGKNNVLRMFDSSDYDSAVALIKQMESEGKSLDPEVNSRYIMHLLKQNSFVEALERAKKALVASDFLSMQVIKLLLSELSNRGDPANIEYVGKFLNYDMRRKAFYERWLSGAYQKADKSEIFITSALTRIQGGEDMPHIPTSFIRNIISKEPHLLQLVERCSEESSAKGDKGISTELMNAFLVEGKEDNALRIYEKYFQDEKEINFSQTCSCGFHDNNYSLFEAALKIVNRHPEGRDKIKAVIYSYKLDLLRKEQKLSEALQVLEDTQQQQNLKLEQFRRDSLSKLKTVVQKAGMIFPYTLAESNVKDSSSSSSSDDDDERK